MSLSNCAIAVKTSMSCNKASPKILITFDAGSEFGHSCLVRSKFFPWEDYMLESPVYSTRDPPCARRQRLFGPNKIWLPFSTILTRVHEELFDDAGSLYKIPNDRGLRPQHHDVLTKVSLWPGYTLNTNMASQLKVFIFSVLACKQILRREDVQILAIGFMVCSNQRPPTLDYGKTILEVAVDHSSHSAVRGPFDIRAFEYLLSALSITDADCWSKICSYLYIRLEREIILARLRPRLRKNCDYEHPVGIGLVHFDLPRKCSRIHTDSDGYFAVAVHCQVPDSDRSHCLKLRLRMTHVSTPKKPI